MIGIEKRAGVERSYLSPIASSAAINFKGVENLERGSYENIGVISSNLRWKTNSGINLRTDQKFHGEILSRTPKVS